MIIMKIVMMESFLQVVVFTDIRLADAISYDDFCRQRTPPIAFIKADVHRPSGSVFCDFGPEFIVFDVDSEEHHTGIIASISNGNPSLISCLDEHLEFQDGDWAVFSEIHGMDELNDGRPRTVKDCRPYSFFLEEDTTAFGAYEKGGIVTQVKQPKVLNFMSLREALCNPARFLLSDFPSLIDLRYCI
jgi:ubiquitin-activating enzyme E1